MPVKHQKAGEWTPERLQSWADSIGLETSQFIAVVLTSRVHPEQAFRSCLGILSLSKKYSVAQLETACKMAREAKTLNYQGVKSVLELLPTASVPEQLPLPDHENIRGESYYQ